MRRNSFQLRMTVRQRMFLTFILMGGLVLLVSGIGILFANSTEQTNTFTRQGLTQIERIAALQQSWMSVTSSVDTILLTRQLGTIDTQINVQINDFYRQITTLQAQSLGDDPQIAAENKIIAENLILLGGKLSDAVLQINNLVRSDRWARAEVLRHTEMASIQRRLNENLSQLSTNISNDISKSVAEARRAQERTLSYWLITAGVALVIASLIGIIVPYSMGRQIDHLTSAMNKITEGDFEPTPPLRQRDEIGDLSRHITRMANQMREAQETFEVRVTERTSELARRTNQIQVAAQIARDISSAREVEELLNRAVNIIRDRFGFYHAGVFLVDVRGEYAILRAATGEAGREMLGQNHMLKVGETGLVGNVTYTGRSRIALDVGTDATHFKNPLLPETRSEMAIPLSIGDRVIGALDVQSTQGSAFDEEDVTVLEIIADQLAVAIENARLIQEVQENLQSLESFYSIYGQQAWKQMAETQPVIGYQYDRSGISPIHFWQDKDKALVDKAPYSIPLQVRGTTIGNLDIWPEQENLTPSDIRLLEEVTTRISQVMESARLFQETQARVAREQIINQMTASISRSLDIETLLNTAVRQLGQLSQVVEVSVHINPADALELNEPSNGKHPSHDGSDESTLLA